MTPGRAGAIAAALAAAILLLPGQVSGAQNDSGAPAAGTAAAESGKIVAKPTLATGFSSPERFRLRAAFRFAVKSLQRSSSCEELFDALGADGLETLAQSVYEPARLPRIAARCGRGGVVAVTLVGGSTTWVCGGFMARSRRDQAAILLHEALHQAGLSEQPHDPDAMTARQITDMVKRACDL